MVAVGVVGDAGALPKPAVGLGVAAGPQIWKIRIEARLGLWLAQSKEVSSGTGGDFSWVTGALDACPWWALGEIGLGGCAGVEVGQMTGTGFGVDNPGEASILWSAARLRALGLLEIAKSFALRVELGAAFPFRRRQWVLERVGPVDRPGTVLARLFFGPELRF